MKPITPTNRFEALGLLYQRRYGRLRPGKSEPVETGRDANSEENRELFEKWLATNGWTDALDYIVEIERESGGRP